MKYLLDTHVLLWVLISTKDLSLSSKNLIFNSDLYICVSNISLWEISLKFNLGKLNLKNKKPDEIPNAVLKMGFRILDLDSITASSFYKLPIINNKDPFDRMIAWQAICGKYILISKDKGFDDYRENGLKRVW